MPDIKSFLYPTFVIVMMFSVAGLVQAKTVYINDQLRVGIRPEPNNDSAPLAVASSGDQLEQLDSDSGYVKVRTSEGVEGWVKDIYTTASIPAIVQLRTLSQSSGGTDKKIKELVQQITMMQAAHQGLNKELQQAQDEKGKIQIQLLALKNGQPEGKWGYWLASMIIFGIISFIFGMFWYRNQAMKRLGGLRIYF